MPNIFSSVLFFRKPSCSDDVIWCNRRWSKRSANTLSFNTCTHIEQNTYTFKDMSWNVKNKKFQSLWLEHCTWQVCDFPCIVKIRQLKLIKSYSLVRNTWKFRFASGCDSRTSSTSSCPCEAARVIELAPLPFSAFTFAPASSKSLAAAPLLLYEEQHIRVH